MAIFDILTDFPGWSTEFDLLWRQEYSRQGNGVTRAKDLGDPLWKATYISKQLSANVLDYWRARMNALDNSIQQFQGRSTSRCYPIRFPNGTGLTAPGTISAVGLNNNTLSFAGAEQLQIGDYFQVRGTDLYQVTDFVASSPVVRPYIWPGTAAGDVVTIVKPYCLMQLVPGSLSSASDPQTGRGSVTFQAVEARNV